MNKRTLYKLHRVLGITALIPIICWTISGLSHPLMSNWLRPTIAKEVYKPKTFDQLKPALSIQHVMDKNNLREIRNFNLVQFDKGTFYQVLSKDSVYSYYSVTDGDLFKDGDKLYAEYLARFFTQDSISAIKQMTLQTEFDSHYKSVNRLLPVWKVQFDRPDGMDVYVETAQARLGTFNNNTRKSLLVFFEQLHTWQFLAALGGEQFRVIVLMVIVSIMFLSFLSGLTVYGILWKRFKEVSRKRKANGTTDRRFIYRYHRQLGLYLSVFMLAFSCSGAFHLYIDLRNSGAEPQNFQQVINRDALTVSNLTLPYADSTVVKTGLVKFNDSTYYQSVTNKKQVLYFNTKTGAELKGGDATYARFLADYYKGFEKTTKAEKVYARVTVNPIKQFTNDYGFINKRLPVQQVKYPNDGDWYVETTSAKLAEKVSGIDRAEGLSFIFLHKFFWMTWAGKDVRDVLSMVAALGVLVVSLLGLTAFIKNKQA